MLEPEQINQIIHKQVNNELPRPVDGFKSLAAENEHKAKVERRFLELHKEFEEIQNRLKRKNIEIAKTSCLMGIFLLSFVTVAGIIIFVVIYAALSLFNMLHAH